MAGVEGVSSSGTARQTGKSVEKNQLDRNAFLKLLITELQSQDPMKPMEDKEFISQLAQFSSLEQMQSMNSNLSALTKGQMLLQASSLVGREVGGSDVATGGEFAGRVESVNLQSDSPLIRVGGKDIPLSSITRVS
ncbi:MAG: flagellar hook capping FlgD N-terminal domain-containing protein [Armatimonadota bacterium]